MRKGFAISLVLTPPLSHIPRLRLRCGRRVCSGRVGEAETQIKQAGDGEPPARCVPPSTAAPHARAAERVLEPGSSSHSVIEYSRHILTKSQIGSNLRISNFISTLSIVTIFRIIRNCPDARIAVSGDHIWAPHRIRSRTRLMRWGLRGLHRLRGGFVVPACCHSDSLSLLQAPAARLAAAGRHWGRPARDCRRHVRPRSIGGARMRRLRNRLSDARSGSGALQRESPAGLGSVPPSPRALRQGSLRPGDTTRHGRSSSEAAPLPRGGRGRAGIPPEGAPAAAAGGILTGDLAMLTCAQWVNVNVLNGKTPFTDFCNVVGNACDRNGACWGAASLFR